MRIQLALSVAALAGWICLGQSLPDPAKLLSQKTALDEHRSYQMQSKMDIEMTMGGAPMRLEVDTTVAAIPPDRLRSEAVSPVGSVLVVANGSETYTYLSSLNQYTKSASVANQQGLLAQVGITKLPEESKLLEKAKTLRQEAFESDGVKNPCWVVQMTLDRYELPQQPGAALTDAVMTVWLDQKLGVVRKMTLTGKMQGPQTPGGADFRQEMTVYGIKLDPPLAEDMFRFTPPAGAVEVPQFGPPPKAGVPDRPDAN